MLDGRRTSENLTKYPVKEFSCGQRTVDQPAVGLMSPAALGKSNLILTDNEVV